MTTVRKMLCLTLLVLGATALAAPSVTSVTAKQRYPWNGKVDISFTLSGPEATYCIAVAATNAATGAEIPVRTLRDTGGNGVSAYTEFATGTVSLVWDAGVDAPGIVVDALALSVVTAPASPRAKVQLWENGPYWATTNIGAEEPEDYGLYFWWGDTVGYRREGNAWVASDGSSSQFSFRLENTPTYDKVTSSLQSEGWVVSKDGTYVLAPQHDAAHVQWGGGWRMPTDQELDDLWFYKCDWTWTTQNGVNGYVVRGRGNFASASIFLPCAGRGDRTLLDYAGSDGNYWSSEPRSDFSGSCYLFFDSDDYEAGTSICRYYGYPVRPVQGFADTAQRFSITLDQQGGSNCTASVTATYGSAMPAITVPMRAGYTFGGYWTEANGGGTQYYDASGASSRAWNLTSATTLYAKWTANERDKVQLWEGGPYWATTNIGAEEPWEYGLYFWWGDTVGYRRENNAWVASDGSSQNFSFYNQNPISRSTYNKSISTLQSEGRVVSKDGDYVLAPKHDAAHVHWGGKWRMPTYQELSDLNSNCDWTWTTQNGVNGYVVRGRGNYASANVFLPAASRGLSTSFDGAGLNGGYWSSSVPDDSDNYSAWYLNFDSGDHGTDRNSRGSGQPVRPVQEFTE